jgi:hypothetical protein
MKQLRQGLIALGRRSWALVTDIALRYRHIP